MSKKVAVKVVIGANYGDEGKGLATRFFTRMANEHGYEKCVNVLFNGGSQRGHTVDLKDGSRHVFSNFGSGTFDGAHTYFDRNFMVNPMTFVNEYETLESQIKGRHLYISPECMVVTPYDIFLNQIVELDRSSNRHGSCGCGIWETKVRYECSEYNKKYDELVSMKDNEIYEFLRNIKTNYIDVRFKEYGVQKIGDTYKTLLDSASLIEHYINDLRFMENHTTKQKRVSSFDPDFVIFEGAQGLELDENNLRAYPHVTASSTKSLYPLLSIQNMRDELELDIGSIEVCYVTRSYFTRHGAGYLPRECMIDQIGRLGPDFTNLTNNFQGELRYGHFDYAEFMNRVQNDIKTSKKIYDCPYEVSLMITHLNENDKILEYRNSFDSFFDHLYLSESKYAEDVIQEY